MGDSGWFSYDNDNNCFIVDFSEAVNDVPAIQELKDKHYNINVQISARGANIDANGYLNISVSASKD